MATRINQTIIDVHIRALRELELINKGYALPNMIVSLNKLFSRISDGLDSTAFGRFKSDFSTNLTNTVS